ncbi:type II toxin-antitoxin system RelE/ParE family toxin [Pseudarthrobacter sp. MDT3-26]|uniref:type II toxin-antitoxin system RelE family toxin n=1 Tax=Pseudarthrobacter raffinosi TaxID=2953651 RepID=UPI00208FDF2A|nr:type II toxin-antitoxin system RelE/ParE family toxin [Pseudarthrobacter sp. MDT3-26]MCO4262543.1 type II toxin-antitoxin system RelE/ParE family toxin [Pseudarthrobacter sp. MDT3-26]
MAYEVIFSPTARRDLQSVPPRILPAIIAFAYGDLSRNPQLVGKALERDLAGFHSARRGPYRVLHSIDEEHNSISILRVDHRADVYRPR